MEEAAAAARPLQILAVLIQLLSPARQMPKCVRPPRLNYIPRLWRLWSSNRLSCLWENVYQDHHAQADPAAWDTLSAGAAPVSGLGLGG